MIEGGMLGVRMGCGVIDEICVRDRDSVLTGKEGRKGGVHYLMVMELEYMGGLSIVRAET